MVRGARFFVLRGSVASPFIDFFSRLISFLSFHHVFFFGAPQIKERVTV